MDNFLDFKNRWNTRCNHIKCTSCLHNFNPKMEDREVCVSCKDYDKWKRVYLFCPWCGCPLTEYSWTMFEDVMNGISRDAKGHVVSREKESNEQ